MNQKTKIEKLNSRFFTVAKCYSIILLLSSLVFYFTEYFHVVLFIVGWFGVVWMIMEFENLRFDSIYWKFVLVSLFLIIYSLFILKNIPWSDSMLQVLIGMRALFFFLVVQRIMRFLFLKFFKREPEFERSLFSLNGWFTFLFLMLGVTLTLTFTLYFKL